MKMSAHDHLGLISASAIETALDCDDILIDILLRVPVKLLLRLKCISRHWLNLISSPLFGQLHSHRNTCSPSGFYLYSSYYDKSSAVPLRNHKRLPTLSFLHEAALDQGCSFKVLDSRRGLLLCSHEKLVPLCYSVANPSTQKYKIIDLPPPTRIPDKFFINACLAFDPTISLHYKVFILRKSVGRLKEVDVYSSEYGYWRRVNVDIASATSVTPIFYWNKAVHWITSKNIHLQFDIDTGKIVENPLPREVCKGNCSFLLSESYGNLILVGHGVKSMMGYAIYEMRKGTHNHWKLKQKVHANTLKQFRLFEDAYIRVLSIQESEIFIALPTAGGVQTYDTKLNTLKVFYDTSSSRAAGFAHYFIESLVPV